MVDDAPLERLRAVTERGHYTILSDIHGNIEALQAVLAKCADDEPLLCLGDTIGYGPAPNACLDELRARRSFGVLGNHDVAAIDDFGLAAFGGDARTVIAWTQRMLTDENRRWLDGLPYELRLPNELFVHGSPVHYFAYCRDREAARQAFLNTDAPIIFVGHTHIAGYFSLDASDEIEQHHMQYGGELQLDPTRRYLINVGSVGQPRDLNPEASYVSYYAAERRVVWHRRAYPIEETIAQIASAGLPIALGQRLLQGR